MPFSASAIFVSPLPHQQSVSLWGHFSYGKTTKKVSWGEIRWIERVGHGGVMPFLVKNCWTLIVVWAGVLMNHPSWNKRTCWKSLQKNSLKLNSLLQQRQLVHWHRWVPKALTEQGKLVLQWARPAEDNSWFLYVCLCVYNLLDLFGLMYSSSLYIFFILLN